MSAARVSRQALPFSQASAMAIVSRLASIAVGHLVQDVGALGGRGLAPGRRGGVRGVERLLDVLGGAAGDLGEGLAGHRRGVLEVLALGRRDVLAADEVVVAGLEGDDASVSPRVPRTWPSLVLPRSSGTWRGDATEAAVASTLHPQAPPSPFGQALLSASAELTKDYLTCRYVEHPAPDGHDDEVSDTRPDLQLRRRELDRGTTRRARAGPVRRRRRRRAARPPRPRRREAPVGERVAGEVRHHPA